MHIGGQAAKTGLRRCSSSLRGCWVPLFKYGQYVTSQLDI